MKFTKLFEPIKIGAVEIPNRVAMIPMNIHFSENDGFTGDEYTCLFTARARGGVGLIIYGAVLASQRSSKQQGLLIPYCFDVSHMHGLGNLTEAVHSFGSKIFIQLSPGFGRQQRHSRQPGWAPSIVQLDKNKYFGNRPHVSQKFVKVHPKWLPSIVEREMTVEDIQQDIRDFVMGAELALFSGFDGIEIHTAHGYLLHQFFSPRTNKRTDRYGGSLENRTRFMVELLQALRKEFGSPVPILVRLSGSEHLPDGLTENEMRAIAKIAVDNGADCIDLTDGTNEAQKWMTPEHDHVHILEEQGKKLKKVVGPTIPIISQSIHNPYTAEQAIANGDTDLIGLGRQLLADPEWAKKVRENRVKDIVRCNRDNCCYIYMYREVGTRCSRNPDLGKERFIKENWPTKPSVLERVPWLSPCGYGCPANIDATLYVHLIANGKFAEAAAVIRQKVPFPGVLGYVCPAFCEKECQRNALDTDEPIAIRMLKRFAVEQDSGLWKQNSKIAPATGKRVAVVGSGPAGLTAAYYLAKRGNCVTVFEALPVVGGMMRVGIPDYRLSKTILDAEITEIQKAGVEIKCNTRIDSINDLFKQGYDAIFLAIGAHRSAKMEIKGDDHSGVLDGASFLREVNLGEKVKMGDDVAVIGGGNVAIDSARTALRLGTKTVTILYRRSEAEMPAYPDEVKMALEEGVKIIYLASPIKIDQDGDRLNLKCTRMQLGEPDASGRPQPKPIKGSEFTMGFNTIISAIGQIPDIPQQFGLATSQQNTIEVNSDTLATSMKGVFAGGDMVSGSATVIEAIAAGRKAAASIDKFLGGSGEIDEILIEPDKVNPYEGYVGGGFDDGHRISPPHIPVEQRLSNFNVVELSLDESTAVNQARRCLHCDVRIPETLRRMMYGK